MLPKSQYMYFLSFNSDSVVQALAICLSLPALSMRACCYPLWAGSRCSPSSYTSLRCQLIYHIHNSQKGSRAVVTPLRHPHIYDFGFANHFSARSVFATRHRKLFKFGTDQSASPAEKRAASGTDRNPGVKEKISAVVIFYAVPT